MPVTFITCTVVQVWLKQPLVDVGEIGGRHDAVESMVDDQMLREGIRDCLRGGWLVHSLMVVGGVVGWSCMWVGARVAIMGDGRCQQTRRGTEALLDFMQRLA